MKQPWQNYVIRMQTHYGPLVSQYGASYQAVDWGSPTSQKLRFQTLLEVGNYLETSILDLGCGVGQLVEYLAASGFQGQYLGLDVLAEMVTCARQTYPGWKFEEGNILDVEDGYVDYVIGSGLFTFGSEELMQSTISSMFRVCRKAVAINSLSLWTDQMAAEEFYADPLSTLNFCRTITPWVVFRHDYLPNDFTIYLYRQQQK